MSLEVMKMALEALEGLIKRTSGQAIYSFMETERRIAMSACVGLRQQIALEKKAENERELGIQMQPADEPVAWANMHDDGKTPALLSISQHPEDRANWLNPVPLYTRPQPAAQSVTYQLSPTDIYDFAGWLTTRKGVMTVGSSCEAGPMAEAVGEYLKTFPERFNVQPAAQWVGLTDEEIEVVSGDYTEAEGFKHGAHWALEQLKEKNA